MSTKTILVKAIQVIVFLFAAFHNFLFNIAPPGEMNTRLAVGFGSMFSLFILLFLAAVARSMGRKRFKKIWLGASVCLFAVALGVSYVYTMNLDRLTFPYPPENVKKEHIAGTEYTREARNYLRDHPSRTPAQLVADFGGLENVERVWTKDSIQKAGTTLLWNYVVVVLSIATMLFCLTEGILAAPKRK